MKNFRAADKSHAGGDEKHDINFHWPYRPYFILNQNCAPEISGAQCKLSTLD
jgi:hypothetical protein